MYTPWIVSGIFVVTYLCIAIGKPSGVVAALIGALILALYGAIAGFLPQAAVPTVIDWDTMGLLVGMMLVVGMMKRTKLFAVLAWWGIRFSRGSPVRLFWLVGVTTALISGFFDNVTTVLLLIPLTAEACRRLGVDLRPFVLAEVFASNIGGVATLIGDPPNILIGSAAALSFMDFFCHVGPIALAALIVALLYVQWRFRATFHTRPVVDYADAVAMTSSDRRALSWGGGVLALTLVLFFVHDRLHLMPATIAFLGAALLLVLNRDPPERALHEVDWSLLLFFGSLFVMVAALERVGVIAQLARGMLAVTGSNLFVVAGGVLIVTGFISSVVNNVPLAAAMVPLITEMSRAPELAAQLSGYTINPLWWALVLGVGLGGNGTLVGASANIVAASALEQLGQPVSFREFLALGIPVMLLNLLISGVLLYGVLVLRL
ncbi:MAG: ArsB/NhaD family transporter [Candidatus Caldarchaeum sp.]